MIKLLKEKDDGQFTVGAVYEVQYWHGKVAWVLDDVEEFEPVYPGEFEEVK